MPEETAVVLSDMLTQYGRHTTSRKQVTYESTVTNCDRRYRKLVALPGDHEHATFVPADDLYLPLLLQPICPETEHRRMFVQVLTRQKSGDSWLSLVPSRVGYNEPVDLATDTVIKASLYLIDKQTVDPRPHLRSYGKALVSVNELLLNDPLSEWALLAVSLLQVFTLLFRSSSPLVFAHVRGINALLQHTVERTKRLNPVAAAVNYWNWMGTFHVPIAMGIPSPFDSCQYLDAEPVLPATWTIEEHRVRKLGHRLFLRLPRLIALVRSLRESEEALPKSYTTAVELAKELLTYKDDSLESEALHRVSVCTTSDPIYAAMSKTSLIYKSGLLLNNLIYYWQNHMILNRLCFALQLLLQKHTRNIDGPATPPSADLGSANFDTVALEATNLRMARNIMMSWGFAISLGPVRVYAIYIAAVALWGVLNARSTYNGMPIEVVQAWVLERYNTSYPHPEYDAQEMDEAAELLAGGPLRGFLVEMALK